MNSKRHHGGEVAVKKRVKATKKPTDVEAYMRELTHPRKREMQAVRKIILGVSPKITESIKWNAPSFALTEHFATFNAWAKDDVQLIFHHGPKRGVSMGSRIQAHDELLEWLASDRASMKFSNMKDVQSKKAALQSIVKQWIKSMNTAEA
ncbi:MAG TPA: DUF1801 domain-containing protein [Anaerolineales bacterium]